jgi:hypothetical protein
MAGGGSHVRGYHQTLVRGPIRAALALLVDLGAWFSPRLRPPSWCAPVRPPPRAVLASGRSGVGCQRTRRAAPPPRPAGIRHIGRGARSGRLSPTIVADNPPNLTSPTRRPVGSGSRRNLPWTLLTPPAVSSPQHRRSSVESWTSLTQKAWTELSQCRLSLGLCSRILIDMIQISQIASVSTVQP